MFGLPRRAKGWGVCLSASVACLWSAVACANEGVFLLGNDALQLGRASSGVASPRSAYWSYMNPASIVDLDARLDTSFYLIFPKASVEPRGLIGNRLDGTLESDKPVYTLSTGFVWPLSAGTLGGAVFTPSGSSVEYQGSRNWLSRLFQGNQDRRQAYQHFRGVLSYAYEFDNEWAVGISLQGSYARFHSDHLTLNLAPTRGDYEWEDAYGAGFGLGIYRRWDRFAFGAGYTSRQWSQVIDAYRDLIPAPIDMPQTVQVGIAYDVSSSVQLTLDYKWINWEDVSTFGSRLGDGGGFNWDDQNGVKAGVEWKVNDAWTLMAGFSHANTPIDDDHVFLSALVPVTVEDHITAGFSHRFNDRHEMHLVGLYAFPNKMTDTGKGDIFSVLGKGSTVEASAISVIMGYTYNF